MLARSTLLVAGYHLYRRGEWRNVVGNALAKDRSGIQTDVAILLKRAQTGDQTALAGLRRVFDSSPELWARVGDLAKQAELSWIAVSSGDNEVAGEALSRRIADLRQELAGLTPTVLERLLVDRVITSWLQVHHADRMCARADMTAHQRVSGGRRADGGAARIGASVQGPVGVAHGHAVGMNARFAQPKGAA
jgi:hypothetical protein